MTITPTMYTQPLHTPHRHIITTLDYCASPRLDFGFDGFWEEKEPYFASLEEEIQPRRCVISDVRGYEDRFDLDRDGFQFARVEEPGRDIYDDAENVVRNVTGAQTVYAINYNLETSFDLEMQPNIPATQQSAQQLLEAEFGLETAQQMLDRGCQLLKVWRPMRSDAKHTLALVDCSPKHSALIKEDLILRKPKSKTTTIDQRYVLKHGDGWDGPDRHVWSYLSDQQTDETVVYSVADFSQSAPQRANGTPIVRVPIPERSYRTDDQGPDAVEVTVVACF